MITELTLTWKRNLLCYNSKVLKRVIGTSQYDYDLKT